MTEQKAKIPILTAEELATKRLDIIRKQWKVYREKLEKKDKEIEELKKKVEGLENILNVAPLTWDGLY